jgi:hypothetical protein
MGAREQFDVVDGLVGMDAREEDRGNGDVPSVDHEW